MQRLILQLLVLTLWSGNLALAADAPAPPAAPATNPAQAKVALVTNTEEGKQVLVATVTSAAGKPVVGARVTFFAQRTFGQLKLGEETTLDDGSAAVAFPADLPANRMGQLAITARVLQPAAYAGACASQSFKGGVMVVDAADPFPRAIWAPRAPLPLLVIIFGLLGAVWTVYASVLRQLFLIYRGGRQ